MPVRIIPARKQSSSKKNAQKTELKKIRVAAYARVSTDSEDQESSHEAQVAHFTELIESREDWALAGIYADEGISGTSTEKREDFNRMIADCEARKIDLVITKSISRFARNTLDSLQYIRKLKSLNIPIVFEKENINTMEYSGELLITIMASIAQQESKSISDNVRLGIQYNFQQGKAMLNHSRFLGYDKDADGKLRINAEEAAIVRRIFREFLEGMNLCEIAICLEADGIPSPSGKSRWYQSTLKSMLKNVKYMGDLLLQRTYTIDFLSKKRAKNLGEYPQYYVKNSHAPIIPREIFMIVQGQLLNKEKERLLDGRKAVPSKHLALNGRVFCSVCGKSYRRDQACRRRTYWRCKTRLQSCKNCAGKPVLEELLQQAIVSACNRLPEQRKALEDIRDQQIPASLRLIEQELARTNQETEHLENQLSEHAKAAGFPQKPLPGAAAARLFPEASAAKANAASTAPIQTGSCQTDRNSMDRSHTEKSQMDKCRTGANQADTDQMSKREQPGNGNTGEAEEFDEYEAQSRLDELQEKCSALLSRKAMLIMQTSNIARVLNFIDRFAGEALEEGTPEEGTSEEAIEDVREDPQTDPKGDMLADPQTELEGDLRADAQIEPKRNVQEDPQTEVQGDFPQPTLLKTGELENEGNETDACRSLEDFYKKTEYPLPSGPLAEYDDKLVRLFITRIIVYPGYLQIRFKSGIDICISQDS